MVVRFVGCGTTTGKSDFEVCVATFSFCSGFFYNVIESRPANSTTRAFFYFGKKPPYLIKQ